MTQYLNGKAPAAAAIRRTLDLLFDPEQVIELRVLVSKKQIDAGYFTDHEKLIAAALGYEGKAPQYVTANAIDPRLLARYNNRVERYAPATTTDDQVIARRWLPIEFDPDRPAGIPASDAEHQEAHRRAQDCRAWLAAYDWPAPIYADSGNGAWLLYRLPDLPNTGELTAKIKRCLAIVSLLYQGQQSQGGIAVKVDATVFNAARIVRLFGTANLKGDGDAASERRNRSSCIVEAPEPVSILTMDAIDRLLAAFPEEQHELRPHGHALNGTAWNNARVELFITQHQIQVAYDDSYQGGHKWVLAECPFNPAHTDKSAVIILGSDGRLGFRCHHNGCTGNDWKALRGLLEPAYAQRGVVVDLGSRRNGHTPAEPPADEPPHPADVPAGADGRLTIDISTIDLPTVMPQAWHAIITANDPPALFRRAGELARLSPTESGALIVKTIDTRVMTGILARAARWVRVSYDRKGNATEKETLPPPAVVDDCMVNIDPRIPPITRVVHAPTFAAGATLLTTPGYHFEARIYYDPKAGAVVPDVPEEPTAGDLERARGLILGELLAEFPFVSDADQAHAVALFLLPFVRELISGPTPLHLIEAPTMGSGKGLLADALLLPALGDVPSPMAEATTDEEWRKRITSALLGAPAVIYIDNLNRMLAAGALAAALTTTEYSDRVLGKSEQVSLPVRCVWVATANNPTLSTEISRRCIRIRIDPRVDKPWQREGFKHPKLRTWIAEHRGDVIWAALVICRYGLQHGTVGRPLGSYEAWSDVLGRILDGCGFSGFLGNLDALYDRADVEGTAWRALIAAWWEKHQSAEQLASDLFSLVAEADADVLISGKDEPGRKRSFGKALARARDRVFSIDADDATIRLQVAAGGVLHKAQRWKLAPVEGGGFGYFGGFFPSAVRTNEFSSTGPKENTQNTQHTHDAPACSGVVEESLPDDLPSVPDAMEAIARLAALKAQREAAHVE